MHESHNHNRITHTRAPPPGPPRPRRTAFPVVHAASPQARATAAPSPLPLISPTARPAQRPSLPLTWSTPHSPPRVWLVAVRVRHEDGFDFC